VVDPKKPIQVTNQLDEILTTIRPAEDGPAAQAALQNLVRLLIEIGREIEQREGAGERADADKPTNRRGRGPR
jgi:hypothetical protein